MSHQLKKSGMITEAFFFYLPGEVVEISRQGVKSKAIIERPPDMKPAFCFFEYVYFARPDSVFEGE